MNATHSNRNSAGQQTLVFAGWLALCFAASGTAIFVSTEGWYAGLHKPLWNPPAWVRPCLDAALHDDGRGSVAGMARGTLNFTIWRLNL
jgi:hypothetical protein